MTRFSDGPAAECHGLFLARSPEFLRVTRSGPGQFDALDLPHDAPGPGEEIFAYRLVRIEGTCYVCFRRGRGRSSSGWFPIASYRFFLPQPADDVLRDATKWAIWWQEQLRKERQGCQNGPSLTASVNTGSPPGES